MTDAYPTAAVATSLDTLKGEASGARLMKNLRELSKWTKLAGTETEAESLRFLQTEMDALGYLTETILHDAYISLPGAASLHVDNTGFRCITHSMSASTPSEGISGDIVDAGNGSVATLEGLNVAGKILLVDGIANPVAASNASKAGAIGVIHVSPHEHIHEMCISPVWGSPSVETFGLLPNVAVVTICDADGEEVRRKLAYASQKATIHTCVDTGWRKTPLLVAELPAPQESAEPGEPFVLFSGHHDTWYYGVMDNGSANVSIIETAKLCAMRRHEWRRGLRICFWSGHSQGRYSGSAWYADEHWADLNRRCVAHVNIDSPGGVGADVLVNTGVMTELRPLAARAIENETGQVLSGKRKARSADESFQGIGIPSMFGSLSGQSNSGAKMRNALGWWWHTPDDLFDKLDEGNLLRDTRILLEVVWRLLTDEVLPIDEAAKVAELRAELLKVSAALETSCPIEPLLAKTEKLEHALRALSEGKTPAGAPQINAALVKVSRALVPLDYSHGDRFIHEPATSIPAWPVLEPLRRLAQCGATSGDQYHLSRVSAVRARNRIAYHVDIALEAVEAASRS